MEMLHIRASFLEVMCTRRIWQLTELWSQSLVLRQCLILARQFFKSSFIFKFPFDFLIIIYCCRISALFKPGENNSDNAMISVYPFGDKYFAFTESPIIHQIDDRNLDTVEKINLSDYIGIINHTSHPHVMADGTVYNLGQTVTKTGPMYNIICFPKSEDMFEEARVVATIPVRWKLHPGYMHTFGITEHYFIIVEQPLTVSVPSVLKNQLLNEPMISSLKWFPEKLTYIYLIERNSGVLKHTFQTESFFYLHIINQYEVRIGTSKINL